MTDNKFTSFSLQTINQRDLLLISIALGLSLFITLNMGGKSYDDAYITYRYAKNLVSGQGFVYNPGESFLGTTTPLFTLLLALVSGGLSSEAIPVIGQWLTGGALFCLAVFTYLLGRDDQKPIAGFISALLVLLNPFFVLVWGGESIFFLALVMAGFYLYFRGQEIAPAVIFGLAFLTRGEGVLPALILFTHYLITKRQLPWRALLSFILTILPWMIYALFTFGSFFPSTLQAKIAQMDSGLWSPFFITSLDMLRSYVIGSPNFPTITPHYIYLVFVLLAFIGGISLLLQPQYLWWSIMAWLGLYALGYTLLGVPFYHWYAVPILYGGFILAGLGAQLGYDFISRQFNGRLASYHPVALGLSGLILCLPFITAAHSVWDYLRQPVAPIQQLYTNTGLWLQENTPPTASVGYFEIGFIGYYSDRIFIDPAGLVNPGVSEQIARRNFKWAYLHYKPDYLVINPVRWYERLGNIREEPWFQKAYQEVGVIEQEDYFDAPITIYQKINEMDIPVP
jgi:hypothetical protein